MASKNTGFHPQDADWTRGRAQAIADAESIARRQIGLTRRVTLTETPDPAVNDPECTDCGGTGITYQTERRCACQPPPDPAAIREDSPNHAYRVGYAAGRAAALREAAATVQAGDTVQNIQRRILALIDKG